MTFLKTGIVGAGLMGFWHAKAAKRAGGRISAIVDSNIETSRRLAGKYSSAKSCSSVEQMLNQTEIDVLHICTPLDTHVEIAELALDAGINLIIEKPITPTAVETEQILGQAANNGVILCAVHQFLFQEGVRKVKRLLSKIGRMIHIESTICSAGADGFAGRQRDLIAADILPHPLSLMQFFLPGDIPCEDWTTDRVDCGEFRAFAKTSQISLSIFISMNARPTECSMEIKGTNGTIYIDLFHGFAFIESGIVSRARKIIHPFDMAVKGLTVAAINLGKRAIRREIAYPGLQRLVSEFYNAVCTGVESPISREDTMAVALSRDYLMQSAGLISK